MNTPGVPEGETPQITDATPKRAEGVEAQKGSRELTMAGAIIADKRKAGDPADVLWRITEGRDIKTERVTISEHERMLDRRHRELMLASGMDLLKYQQNVSKLIPAAFEPGKTATLPTGETKIIAGFDATFENPVDNPALAEMLGIDQEQDGYRLSFQDGTAMDIKRAKGNTVANAVFESNIKVDGDLTVEDIRSLYTLNSSTVRHEGNNQFGDKLDAILKHSHTVDPRTGQAFSSDVSPEDRRRIVKESIRTVKKEIVAQYRVLAEMPGKLQSYLTAYPEAGFLELQTALIGSGAAEQLTPEVATAAARGIMNGLMARWSVEHYGSAIKKDPATAAKNLCRMGTGDYRNPVEIKGEIDATESFYGFNFNFHDKDDYARAIAGLTKNHALAEYKATRAKGLASNVSHEYKPTGPYADYQGTVTISRGLTGEQLDSTVTHEQRHRLNSKLFPEHQVRGEAKGELHWATVMVKDEIIAHIDQGSRSREDIEERLKGSYDPFPQLIDQARRNGDTLTLQTLERQRESYQNNVTRMMEQAYSVRKSDGTVDLDLLAVTPVRRWEMLTDEKKDDEPR